jgi:hypothetical protein
MAVSIKSSSKESEEGIVESRIVKKSYLKHHDDCIRMKHVKISQLETFRLDLMYRFIFHGIGTDEAKDLMNLTP